MCGLAGYGLLVSSPLRAASPDTAPPLPAPSGNVVTVSNIAQLNNAFGNLQDNQTIVLNAGTYNLTGPLYVKNRRNVTVRGVSNDRNAVVLSGGGMTNPNGVSFGIWTGWDAVGAVGAPNVMIANLTIRDFREHPVIMNPGTSSPRIYNVRLVNAGDQFIKVNPDLGSSTFVNNGIVEYSVMEYDTTAADNYTNGVDVHGGANWIIRHNLFRRIRAPQGQLAGPAILMWRGASGTVVEGNTFIDCQRDIALGFESGVNHSGGIIRNNFIYRSGIGGDVAISVFGSPNTKIVHNTIVMGGDYPNSIETRYVEAAGIQIVNNLSDKGPLARDGSQFTQQGNVWTATPGLFANSVPGDLHLLATAMAAIDRGVPTNDAPLDWDGQARAGTWDVGADEYFAAGPPPPPPPPPAEICGNGIDDDLDGLIDEGCTTTPPPPPPPPPVEVCGDGIDNDGDGQVDEGCAPPPAPAVPGAPSRLTGHVTGATVSFSWLPPIVGTAPTSYVVEAGVAPGQTAVSVPLNQTSLTVPGVGVGRYYIRVKAQNASGLSAASNEVAVTVGCGAVSTPRALTSATSGQLVSLNWVDPDGCSGTRYLLAVGSTPGAANLAVLPLDTPNVTVGAPAAVYYARVATQSAFGISAPSNEVQIVVGSSECQPPAFGLNLSANVVGRTVLLSWNPASTAAALAADAITPIQYALEVGASAGAATLAFPLGRTTALAVAAPPGDFYVRVRALNVCGAGPASADQLLRVR